MIERWSDHDNWADLARDQPGDGRHGLHPASAKLASIRGLSHPSPRGDGNLWAQRSSLHSLSPQALRSAASQIARRVLLLFVEMTDQAGAARDQGEAARNLGGHAAIAEHGRDRAGGVDGDVAAVGRVDGAAESARCAATWRPATPRSRASSNRRGARGSSGLWVGWPKPGSGRARGAMLDGDARLPRRRHPRPPRSAASSAAQPSMVPTNRLPTPSSPAATAPCIASGALE